MKYQTKVRVYVQGEPRESVACAIIHLCDRDRLTPDDLLGMDITDTYGEASFSFTETEFLDLDDHLGGALPELYVKVFDRHGDCVFSSRTDAVRNAVPEIIEVEVPREIASRHQLI